AEHHQHGAPNVSHQLLLQPHHVYVPAFLAIGIDPLQSSREGGGLLSRGREGDSGSETADHLEIPPAPGPGLGAELWWKPEVASAGAAESVSRREVVTSGQHADYLSASAVEDDGLPHHRGIAAEAATPVALRDDHDPRPAFDILFRGIEPAGERSRAHHGEVA